MKQRKGLIAFRPKDALGTRFWSAVEVLGVSDSDLARRALSLGLDQAANEIAAEKRREAERMLSKLKGKLSFNTPLTHGDRSVMLVPVV